MGFFAMNLFISTTEGADIYFNGFNDCIGKPLLTEAGVTADRAQFTHAGQ